jgi:hypothetical protein
MHRPDTSAGYGTLYADVYEPLGWLPLTETAAERAFEIRRALAAHSNGYHRRPPIELLIAPIAGRVRRFGRREVANLRTRVLASPPLVALRAQSAAAGGDRCQWSAG